MQLHSPFKGSSSRSCRPARFFGVAALLALRNWLASERTAPAAGVASAEAPAQQ